MKNKIILFITLILFYTSVFSQQQLTTDLNYNAIHLKFNSTSVIDKLSFPTVELAIEKNFGNYYAIQFETGIQLYKLLKESIDTINVKSAGYRFKIEGRYYFKGNFTKSSTIKAFYFTGMGLIYRYNTYNTNYSFFKESNSVNNSNSFNYMNDNIGYKKVFVEQML